LLNPSMSALDHEQFWVVYLNRANKIIHYECVGRGGPQPLPTSGWCTSGHWHCAVPLWSSLTTTRAGG
jgi:hypothetical protein